MIPRRTMPAAGLLAVLAAAAPAFADSHLNLVVSPRWMIYDEEWPPFEAPQRAVSIAGLLGSPGGSRAHGAFGVHRSSGEGRWGRSTEELTILEASMGFAALSDPARVWRGYLGIGLNMLRLRTQREGHSARSSSRPGLYANGGVFFRVGRRLELGLDLRMAGAANPSKLRQVPSRRATRRRGFSSAGDGRRAGEPCRRIARHGPGPITPGAARPSPPGA
jgi:hypothetical protein